MKNKLYRIHVKNWNEHNENHRKTYKSTLIKNNFCHDNKLSLVPVSVRWMFLGILLTCGDHARDTVEMSESQLRALLESSKSVFTALSSLQSIHIITFEEVDLPLILIELKRKNRKERKEAGVEPPVCPPSEIKKPPEQDTQRLKEASHPLAVIWNFNCGRLPKVKNLGRDRLRKARARWTEQTAEQWVATVKRIASSDFCNGSTGWIATFDWLVSNSSNWAKVVDGNYDNRAKQGSKNWESVAMNVIQAVRKYGSANAAGYSDEETVRLVRSIGGFSAVGSMPHNDFSMKKLAGLLRAASENQPPPSMTGAQDARGLREGGPGDGPQETAGAPDAGREAGAADRR